MFINSSTVFLTHRSIAALPHFFRKCPTIISPRGPKGTKKEKTHYKNNICIYVHMRTLGNSRKYPYPTTDGFHILTPPCLRKFQNALAPPMPSEFHNREPPLPFRISSFFWKYIFDLATPIWTNEHEFMPPRGCDLAAPGDKLYSSATRKTYR